MATIVLNLSICHILTQINLMTVCTIRIIRCHHTIFFVTICSFVFQNEVQTQHSAHSTKDKEESRADDSCNSNNCFS